MLSLRGRGTSAMAQAHPLEVTNRAGSVGAGKIVDKYLQKELKIDLYQQQQASLVEALKDPSAWLAKRDTAMKKLTAELSEPYYDAIDKYMKLYPVDEAVELANQEIKALFDIKMKHLDFEQPGASFLFQGAVIENNKDKVMGNALLSHTSKPSNDEFEAYYKKRKAAKKAKKETK